MYSLCECDVHQPQACRQVARSVQATCSPREPPRRGSWRPGGVASNTGGAVVPGPLLPSEASQGSFTFRRPRAAGTTTPSVRILEVPKVTGLQGEKIHSLSPPEPRIKAACNPKCPARPCFLPSYLSPPHCFFPSHPSPPHWLHSRARSKMVALVPDVTTKKQSPEWIMSPPGALL